MNEREIFLSALEIKDPSARQAHLQSACAEDAALVARVEALLASHEGRSEFLNTPVVEQMADDAAIKQTATLQFRDESAEDAGSGLVGRSPCESANPDSSDEILLGYLQPSSKSDSLGRMAHYEILEVIGRGAFGTVLKAFDDKLQRVVAIKMMAPEMAAASPARKRFLREARASAKIRHENVVAIHAVDDDPLPYLVMEYIPGQTLQQRLDEHGPLDLRDVLRLGKQVADGLAAAHAQELIHRDVKPGNILLDDSVNDHVKITDFGLARTADDASVTQSGMIAGTPMYMAPEQALGKKLDQRADLFSLGSVLYQMISGRPPFRAPNTMAVLKRVTEDTPRPIQEIIPETPVWICKLIANLHQKNPEDRYTSAKEVADLLGKCLAELEQGRIPKIPNPKRQPNLEPVPAQTASSLPAPRRRRAILAAAAIFLLLIIPLGLTEATGVTQLSPTVIRLWTGSGTLVIESNDPSVKITVDGAGEKITIRGGGLQELTLQPGKYKIYGKGVKQELVTIARNGRTKVRISIEPNPSPRNPDQKAVSKSNPFQWPNDAPSLAIAPFNAQKAKEHQEAWAKYLGVPVEKEIVVGKDKAGKEVKITMVLIPPGQFLMGSTEKERTQAWAKDSDSWFKKNGGKEYPQHRVRINKPFWLSRHEVTIGQFRQFVNRTKYRTDGERDGKGGLGILNGRVRNHPRFVWNDNYGLFQEIKRTDDFPVSYMSWNDATKFCKWLSEQSHALKFGLPTEAQWEFACRAGTTTWWHFGDSEAELGQYQNKFGAVGQLKPNAFGLFDMHGNVSEWCADVTEKEYYANSPPLDDPAGLTSGDNRVHRGGFRFFTAPAAMTRSAYRFVTAADGGAISSGFRVAAPLRFTDADVQRIAELQADYQATIVIAELKRRNPRFDSSSARYTVEDGEVVELKFRSDYVNDISPMRALTDLKSLDCSGSWDRWNAGSKTGLSKLADLSPLQGLKLTTLHCNGTEVADLSPLRGMHLEDLSLAFTLVKDLSAIDTRALRSLHLTGSEPLRDAGLAHLNGCKNLTSLGLGGTQAGDAGLAHFKDCTNLTVLDLKQTKVTDAGLVYFKNCKNLTALNLSETQVGDAGMAHFKHCNKLIALYLRETQVSDAGLAHFKNCKNLQDLFLPAKVTNVGLAHFKDCQDLTRLGIRDTKVTDYSLLKGMALQTLWCDFQAKRDTRILRSIGSLAKINGRPVAEFWKNVR